jgi:superfamily I DNA/RNA helicase
MPTPLLANLNPEQLEAVTLPHGSALVLAGAGSGKTRVLTTRIAWLLATGQASPLSVLAVTFTKRRQGDALRLSAMSVRGIGSAPSTACATGCCARTTATPTCRSCSRSSIRRTSWA